ncbi:hypothetical protein C8Q77DRAFT_1217845 [Trametes polyzona]|nr:hypothetical protein C8Q77DRAFT_1217845 [Trametes polyzona]
MGVTITIRRTCLPIWLYCDDTSGNVSKKWNKHNSILFVLGGLPREATQKLYNVHFLLTSNIASPLEMMEHLSHVLKAGREDGVAVWDCQDHTDALVIPWVLAFQGDNPMASEFASHIGMKGKHFCHICHACAGSGDKAVSAEDAEAAQLTEFLQEGKARYKSETIRDLAEQERRAFEGAPSAVEGLATESGTKDKYLQYFIDALQAKLTQWREDDKRTHGEIAGATPWQSSGPSCKEREQEFLRTLRAEMPEDIRNPVLNIPDFDPNTDSPVEILHVVLLGVVKYWWRDVCARQDHRGKRLLETRLSSVAVDGLGISPLRGHTLVHYAGSLIGHDFRIILQVAPAVLYGLIPGPAYQAWLALCRLAPMVFQPEIGDLPAYKVSVRLRTFSLRLRFGRRSGSTSRSSTCSCILCGTSSGSALLPSVPRRPLNHTTLSSACAA